MNATTNSSVFSVIHGFGDNAKTLNFMVHSLKSGATLTSLSPHGFKFSDGTESGPQNKEIVEYFTLEKEFRTVRRIKGMRLTSSRFIVSPQQKEILREISRHVDLVLVPFQFLQALQDSLEAGESFPSVVAFNATKETMRSAPDQKVVDIDNWSVISRPTWQIVRSPDYIVRDRYGQDTVQEGEEIISSHSTEAEAKSNLKMYNEKEGEMMEVLVSQDYISCPWHENWKRFRICRVD